MTVIAWDGKTLAADKRATGGTITTVTKIRRTGDGRLMGVCGDGSVGRELMGWADAGEVPATWPAAANTGDATLMVIERGQLPRVYYARPFPMHPEGPHFAIGSGEPYAMTAMYLGHGAKAGVEAACMLIESCGNGIDTLTLET